MTFGIFWSPVEHPFFSLISRFLENFELRLKPLYDHTFTAGPDLMCPKRYTGKLAIDKQIIDFTRQLDQRIF